MDTPGRPDRRHPVFGQLVDAAAAEHMRVGLVAGAPYGPEGRKRQDIVAITITPQAGPDRIAAKHEAWLDTLDDVACGLLRMFDSDDS